jgi:hypothetical protein
MPSGRAAFRLQNTMVTMLDFLLALSRHAGNAVGNK